MSSEKLPLLFDTDIGSDIDDAIALTYLLMQPRCDLLGITTVTGQPQVRAQLSDAVCRAFGRQEVPVYSGAAKPLLGAQLQPEVPQKAVLPHWPHREKFALNVAVDFLRQTIRSRPREITLLSVGPLTNIGLLFALDPEIPTLLKQYVMMGGAYIAKEGETPINEWNTRGDAYATAIVFAANAPGTRCVGLDVTTRCKLPAEECRRRFSKGPLKIVGDMAEVWFKGAGQITFHDPLATACVFTPELCTFQPGTVEIELKDDQLRGVTRFNSLAGGKPPHQIAIDVKPDAFFQHYFEIVEHGSSKWK